MKLYGLKSCDTCRKALKFLAGHGMSVEFVDVRAQGVAEVNLSRFHAAFGDALMNRRSATWRRLSEKERSNDPLILLATHSALMKRPVIELGDSLYLGWGEDVRNAILG